MLVGGDRDRDPRRPGDRRAHLLDRRPAREPALGRQPGLDLLLLRRRLPGQDAGLPDPRLDARRLPRRAAAGGRCCSPGCSRRSAPTASCGSCCRSIPDATVTFQELVLVIARRLDPLRLGDGVHADERAPDRRLLLDRPARLHHPRDLQPARRRRRRRGAADGQPRARRRRRSSSSSRSSTSAPGPRTCARWAAWRCARRCSPRSSWSSRWRPWRCPGSANFIGEFYILNGVFQAKIAFAFVAAIGVALAAFYALRLYQRTMHNRLPEGVESREISLRDGLVLAPLVACIVALALWPGLILERGEARWRRTSRRSTERGGARSRRRPWRLRRMRHRQRIGRRPNDLQRPRHRLRRALAGDRADRRASSWCCSPGCSASGARQRIVVSILGLGTLAAAAGLCIWQWGESKDLVAGRAAARRPRARGDA